MERRATKAYSPVGQRCADAGKDLGDLVRCHPCASPEDFYRLVIQPPHHLLPVVLAVHHMRGHTRPLGAKGDTLLQAIQRQPQTLRIQRILTEAWSMYRFVRQRACPRAKQPAVQPEEVPLPWTRAVSRYLRPVGIRPPAETYSAQVRASQGSDRLRQVWQALAGRSAVIWVDNYARQRYRRTPQGTNVSLNVTVMAVMRVPGSPLPPFPGYPSLEQLHHRHLQLAADLAHHATHRLPALIAAVVAEPLRPSDFRVPLDVPRPQAHGVVWRAFNLSDDRVGSQVGLLQVLRFLRTQMADHVRPHPLPVLVDENVWYRTLKLLYGREAQGWDVPAALERLPPLYGVWHPYKQVVNTVYRHFLPLLLYLQNGTLPVDGHQVSTLADLQTIERWLGGLLLLDRDQLARTCALRDDVRNRNLRAAERAWDRADAELHAARARHDRLRESTVRHVEEAYRRERGLAEALGGSRELEEAAKRLRDTESEHVRASQSLRRAKADVAVLDALVDLLTVWAPACLLLGTAVRGCTWDSRAAGTGGRAREVLVTSLLLLLRLEGAGERWRTSKYIRTLSLALLFWDDSWHGVVPACCYAEEVNEATLSRLGRSLRQHPDAVTTDAAMDLYLAVRAGRPGPKNLPAGGVGRQWQQTVRTRLEHLLTACGAPAAPGPLPQVPVVSATTGHASEVVTYVTVLPNRYRQAERDWPEGWRSPTPPTQMPAPAADFLAKLLRSNLYALMADNVPAPDVAMGLDAVARRRTDAETEAYRTQWDNLVARAQPKPRAKTQPKATPRPFGFQCVPSGEPSEG